MRPGKTSRETEMKKLVQTRFGLRGVPLKPEEIRAARIIPDHAKTALGLAIGIRRLMDQARQKGHRVKLTKKGEFFFRILGKMSENPHSLTPKQAQRFVELYHQFYRDIQWFHLPETHSEIKREGGGQMSIDFSEEMEIQKPGPKTVRYWPAVITEARGLAKQLQRIMEKKPGLEIKFPEEFEGAKTVVEEFLVRYRKYRDTGRSGLNLYEGAKYNQKLRVLTRKFRQKGILPPPKGRRK